MAPDRVSLARLWALMATVFVDMMGFLMVMPVLPFYADRLGASPLLIGLMVSVFALAQLLMAPYLGKISDRKGRRPTLMFGISIAAVAFLLLALACSEWAMARISPGWLIALIFISRFVAGAGGATTGVVQAYVGDAIVPEERAKALGWISAATNAGVMIGPALGSLAAFGGPAVPGLIATGLCLLNLLVVKRGRPESSSAEARAEAKQEQRESLGRRMLAVFQNPQLPVARLIWIYAVGMMAFMGMNAVLALFLQQRFGITEKSFGLFYVFVGAISLVMRSVLLGPAVRRFGEKGVMRIGLLSLAGGYALQALAPILAEKISSRRLTFTLGEEDDEETQIAVIHVQTDEELGFIFADEGEYVFESNHPDYFDDFVDDDAERFVERLYETLRADLPKYEVENKR